MSWPNHTRAWFKGNYASNSKVILLEIEKNKKLTCNFLPNFSCPSCMHVKPILSVAGGKVNMIGLEKVSKNGA